MRSRTSASGSISSSRLGRAKKATKIVTGVFEELLLKVAEEYLTSQVNYQKVNYTWAYETL